MLSDTTFRWPSLGVCLAVLAAGCGTHEMPVVSGPDRIPAPRRIELPPDMRPLISADGAEEKIIDASSVPAQYQQPTTKSAEARIVEVSSSTASPSAAIREPLVAGPVATMAAEDPPRRSEFVPIALPEQTATPVAAAVPPLPVAAQFATPAVAAGPELVTPNREVPSLNNRDYPQPVATPAHDERPRGGSLELVRSQGGPWEREVTVVQQSAALPPQPVAATQMQQASMMQAAAQRAMQMANHASTMAQRGMLFSAKAELIKALTLISQTLDVQEGSTTHGTALAAGLAALNEAKDFASVDGRETVNIASIAATHRTALSTALTPGTNPLIAQQEYFAYAQTELTFAVSGVPAASEILYRLGRLQTALAAHDTSPTALHAPQSIVFHQAALAADGNNWLAANELGVLYARYGQLQEARQLLVRSVTLHPHREGWHNLAAIHRRLGETDLAQRAETERLALERQGSAANDTNTMVRMVDPKTFAASGGGDVSWPASVAAKSVQTTGATRR